MNTCESYAALLDAFAEGDLFTEDMLQVQTHLNNCPACQAYLDDLFAIRAAFPTIEETEVPAGFADGVMAAVAAHPRAAAPVAPTRKKTPWSKVLLPLAACCAIVVLLQGGPFGSHKQESAYQVAYTAPASREIPETEVAEAVMDEPAAAAEEGAAFDPQESAVPAKGEAPSTTQAQSLHTADSSAADSKHVVYQHRAELPAEAAALLEEFAPAEETAEAAHYLLTAAEYAALQNRLADAGISYLAEDGIDPTTDLVLVLLSK